jgi:hypothetical protein
MVSVLRGEGHLGLILELSAERDGKTSSWRRVNHYQIIEGRIVEGWIYESNQYIVDEIFA